MKQQWDNDHGQHWFRSSQQGITWTIVYIAITSQNAHICASYMETYLILRVKIFENHNGSFHNARGQRITEKWSTITTILLSIQSKFWNFSDFLFQKYILIITLNALNQIVFSKYSSTYIFSVYCNAFFLIIYEDEIHTSLQMFANMSVITLIITWYFG